MRRLLLVAALAACGGGDISIDELGDELISTVCETYVECGYVEDHETCREVLFDADIDRDLIAAVDAGKVIYHADKARECIDGFRISCERTSVGPDTSACEEVFEGTVMAGGQCALDEECISQDCDIPSCPDSCCQGTCIGNDPPVRPRLGEACDLQGESCVNSFCDDTTSTCTAYLPTGQACTASRQCETGVCANQVCTALPGPGEPCSPQIAFGLCNHMGYTCSSSSMTCEPYGLTGDACTTSGDCSPVYDCGSSGTCELGPTVGDSCAGPEGPVECVDASFCDAATMICTAPKANGAPCDANAQCASRNCDGTTNTCTTPPVCI